MAGAIRENPHVRCFFFTGTGRCGTKLFAELFSMSRVASCLHEKFFQHAHMIEFFKMRNRAVLEPDIRALFLEILKFNLLGMALGVSSGHMYFYIPELYPIFQNSVRFVLLVRKPDAFARSALARGFFDPCHPNYCIPLEPSEACELFGGWGRMSPLEKCLWYWRMVNDFVLDAFDRLPPKLTKVVWTEEIQDLKLKELCAFLGVVDISDEQIRALLARRINVTPTEEQGKNIEPNPYSRPLSFPPLDQWSDKDKELYEHYTRGFRLSFPSA